MGVFFGVMAHATPHQYKSRCISNMTTEAKWLKRSICNREVSWFDPQRGCVKLRTIEIGSDCSFAKRSALDVEVT